jgi:ABC-type multidrug transport system fused ATPase/permease subunit
MITGREVPKQWPGEGRIDLRGVTVKYGNDPPVLHAINVTIKPREKVYASGIPSKLFTIAS